MTPLIGFHPVREALRAGRPLERLLIAKGAAGPRIQELVDLCRAAGIPVRVEERAVLDRMAGVPSHQGLVAFASAHRYVELEDVSGTLIVLDGVEDPHNLGAIVRTAHAAGAGAVVVPERRAAPLTDVVDKAAAGALEYLPVARVVNLNRALDALKKRGYWIYGFDERGSERYDRIDYATPTALVFGGEGAGLHEQVRKHCDFLVSIPMAGPISSLNVSVAAGVVLFEARRRASAKE
jgi:23S rRNA (guanosine2251-2'-O)-methyltransferase